MLRAFYRTDGSMCSNGRAYTTRNGGAYFIGIRFNAKLINVG